MDRFQKKIEDALLVVIGVYPNITRGQIIVRYKPIKTTMNIGPHISFLYLPKSRWKFVLTINTGNQNGFSLETADPEIVIGFLAHELAHVLDYARRSRINLILLGVQYLLSRQYRRFLERDTDVLTIMHGFGSELLQSYESVLSGEEVSQNYKKNKKEFYLSPTEISKLVKNKIA